MARAAHGNALLRPASHLDHFLVRRKIAIEALEVEVLDVGPRGREPPRDAVVPSDEDPRHARQRAADRIDPWGVQVREVPHRRRRKAEVRIGGEERLTGRSAGTGNRPAVGSAMKAALRKHRGLTRLLLDS